jgi:16S rRNA (guanine527-N7)-methyltransferase
MGPDLRSRIEAVASSSGAPLEDSVCAQLVTWLDLLVTWNAKLDLTAARSHDELVDLMLADAFALSSRIPKMQRVIDVGTGAGAPGLPLALLRPDLPVTLIEPLAKRTSFLRTFLAKVQRTDVVLRRAKGEDARADAKLTPWDVALSRATLAPPAWLALGMDLVGPRGSVWVLLAQGEAPMVAGTRVIEDFTYAWPLTTQTRRALRYQREVLAPSPTAE